MSVEKDLLVRAKVLLECLNTEPLQDQADIIIGEIKELLAPPIPKTTAEPVAWYWEGSDFYDPEWIAMADTGDKPIENRFRRNIQPLYLAPPIPEPIAYVADSSVGFDVSHSAQGMPLIWLGKLEYGDKLYKVGKDERKN